MSLDFLSLSFSKSAYFPPIFLDYLSKNASLPALCPSKAEDFDFHLSQKKKQFRFRIGAPFKKYYLISTRIFKRSAQVKKKSGVAYQPPHFCGLLRATNPPLFGSHVCHVQAFFARFVLPKRSISTILPFISFPCSGFMEKTTTAQKSIIGMRGKKRIELPIPKGYAIGDMDSAWIRDAHSAFALPAFHQAYKEEKTWSKATQKCLEYAVGNARSIDPRCQRWKIEALGDPLV